MMTRWKYLSTRFIFPHDDHLSSRQYLPVHDDSAKTGCANVHLLFDEESRGMVCWACLLMVNIGRILSLTKKKLCGMASLYPSSASTITNFSVSRVRGGDIDPRRRRNSIERLFGWSMPYAGFIDHDWWRSKTSHKLYRWRLMAIKTSRRPSKVYIRDQHQQFSLHHLCCWNLTREELHTMHVDSHDAIWLSSSLSRCIILGVDDSCWLSSCSLNEVEIMLRALLNF